MGSDTETARPLASLRKRLLSSVSHVALTFVIQQTPEGGRK